MFRTLSTLGIVFLLDLSHSNSYIRNRLYLIGISVLFFLMTQSVEYLFICVQIIRIYLNLYFFFGICYNPYTWFNWCGLTSSKVLESSYSWMMVFFFSLETESTFVAHMNLFTQFLALTSFNTFQGLGLQVCTPQKPRYLLVLVMSFASISSSLWLYIILPWWCFYISEILLLLLFYMFALGQGLTI